MKACSKNREGLVLLALGGLEAQTAHELRQHLERCAGCRSYFEEMAHLAERLATPDSAAAMQTSERFHQRVVRALVAEEARPARNQPTAFARWLSLGESLWPRLAWGLAVTLVAGLAVLAAFYEARPHSGKAIQPIAAQLPPDPKRPADLQPSLANYQRMADRSPEALDELLERQVKTLSGSRGMVYTAGARSL